MSCSTAAPQQHLGNGALDGLTQRAKYGARRIRISPFVKTCMPNDNKQKLVLPVTIQQKIRCNAVILVALAADCVAWKDDLSSVACELVVVQSAAPGYNWTQQCALGVA